jgi:integrase
MVDALAEPGTKLADSPNRRSISENRALSGVTQRNILGVLNAALRYATQHRLIDHNPCDYVRKPRAVERKVKDHIWSGEQLRAFLDATAERRDWTLWWVAAYTAMRRSELLGLQWGDVDLDAATLRVQRRRVRVGTEMITGESTKTHKDRTVSIDPDTVAALRRWQRQLHEERLAAPPGVYAADSPWVFVDEIGRPTSADQVDGRWRRAMRNADADLPRIRFHDLRHTHASLLLAAGVDPIAVADRLGHANATMVLTVYGHAIKSRGPSIAAAFADAVGR